MATVHPSIPEVYQLSLALAPQAAAKKERLANSIALREKLAAQLVRLG